jgi:hypothetical protein
VFNLTNQPFPTYYKLLEKVKAEISGLSNNVMISSNGGEITQLTDDQEELLQDYKMIQYDILEGENYAAELLFK